MNHFLFLFALYFVIEACASMVCPPDICLTVRCGLSGNCTNGHIEPHAGYCGCCAACIHHLGLREECSRQYLLGGTHHVMCAPGLYCDPNNMHCYKMPDTNCTRQRYIAQLIKAQRHLLGYFIPSCDPDNTFSAVQCHGSKCSCVRKDGTHIYGYIGQIGSGMKCRCARDQAEYVEKGLIGRTFRCEANGNYANIQCKGSVCYCVDEFGLKRSNVTVNIMKATSLQC